MFLYNVLMTQAKLSKIKRSIVKDFSFFSHRGFGEKTHARYFNTQKLRYVHNQLTGLELGIQHGADTLEIDLCKTKDGKIVTAHGIILQKYLSETEQEYLHKYPESLTFQELLDWIYHQHSGISLYLELKSPVTIQELLKEITQYAEKGRKKNNNAIISKLYQQLIVYTHDLQTIKNLIYEKQKFGLSTLQLQIFWVSIGFISNTDIDTISRIGTKRCRIAGVEQGTLPWGFKPFVYFLNLPLPPFLQIKKRLKTLKTVIACAHKKNLRFIVGTIDDPQWIRVFIKQGVNGIVPNNPSLFFQAGVTRENTQKKDLIHYLPPSMKQRLYLK